MIAVTYGTFDLFHVGHVRLLNRVQAMATEVHVGVSTDAFNAIKGKRSVFPESHRMEIVQSVYGVTSVFPERSWDQKASDIARLGADVLVMGDDWEGRFDSFRSLCEVVYLPRTAGVSSTQVRSSLSHLEPV